MSINQTKFPLWESESNLTVGLKQKDSVPSHQLLLGFSVTPKPITGYTHFTKMILHPKYSDITSTSYVQNIMTTIDYTDGSKMGNRVASAVVWQKSCRIARLPNNASIFGAELYAITLALGVIRHSKDKHFIFFSDSMRSLVPLSEFKLELDLVQKILQDYTTLTNSGKSIILCWIPSHVNI